MSRVHLSWLAPCVLALTVALAITASSGATTHKTTRNGGTFVYGTAFEPVFLDPALEHDPESDRVANQIFEGLVDVAPGRTRVVPGLAKDWHASRDGRTWTFFLRRGVKFQDGTRLDAAAVCFNFERWYGFAGSLQNAAWFWGMVFGGFHHPAPPADPQSTGFYRSCQSVGRLTVRLRLSRATTSFLAAQAFPSFGIASPTALRKYDADAGYADKNGVFYPTGTYGTAHPTGTGPFMFKSRRQGEVVLVRNPHYWGRKAKLDRLVFRTIPDRTKRLHALQRGTIDGLDAVLVGAVGTIRRDPRLKVLNRPSGNVGYVGMNQAIPPMNKLLVRQAVAYGLDRARVVRSFYADRGQLADQFLPPSFLGHARHVKQYRYDPERSRALLRKAGLTLPVKIDFWYPTDTSRPYMPDPRRNFGAFAAGLARAGFKVVPHSAPWLDYLPGMIRDGKYQLYLGGWIADFPDPDNFFEAFRGSQPMFGFRNPTLFKLVARADAETNLAKRARLYERASRLVMKLLPFVPYANFRYAVALQKNVTGFVPDSSGPVNESFATVGFASR
jgi:peptide/nickel transport system substrate-binding protein